MSQAMSELLSILDLEKLEHNLYRGISPKVTWIRVFGGQVIAQSLVAAQRTVSDDRFVHSLHGYFMLPGDPTIPIVYSVDRIRDGGSFTTRRVTAIQRGHAIFSLEASFQKDEEGGLDFQQPMPVDVPMPEVLAERKELIATSSFEIPENIRRFWEHDRPVDMKPVTLEHYTSRDPLPPQQNVWVRANGPVPKDRTLRTAILAYLSDMTLLDTATFPHGRAIFDPDLQVASLDHAMWFHRPADLSGWLLYTQDTPSSSGSRGFTRGMIYSRDGTLIASVAQEGLIRLRT
jgi:acyl-CoA thioesterase-2